MIDYHTASGVGTYLDISNKQVREVLKFINGMNVDKAIRRLESVIEHKEAVPYNRFKIKVAHKPGMMTGKFPEKTCFEVIKVLNNAKNNALNKGLQEDKLFIKEGVTMMCISKRKRIRSRKSGFTSSARLTSFKIILAEKEEEKKVKPKKEVDKK